MMARLLIEPAGDETVIYNLVTDAGVSSPPDPEPPADHWERIPLSVYYAAAEAHEQAEAVTR